MAISIVAYSGDGSYTVAFDDDYYIDTTLTASGDKVDWWLDEIYRKHHRRLDRIVVGLDVEWRPPSLFVRGTEPPVAVLQICVGCRCLVFQILRADYVPDSLADFLADDRFTFVGVGIDDDVAKLRRRYGLEVEKVEDLRYLAANTLGKPDLRKAGLQTLVREVLGVRLEKPLHLRISAWDAPRLSPEQLQYACVDAFASSEVGRRLYDGEYTSTRFRIYCLKSIATLESIVATTIFLARIYCLKSIATLESIVATTIFLATIISFGVVVVLAYPTS